MKYWVRGGSRVLRRGGGAYSGFWCDRAAHSFCACIVHSVPGGVWGHAPPVKFLNFDHIIIMRVLLRPSETISKFMVAGQ